MAPTPTTNSAPVSDDDFVSFVEHELANDDTIPPALKDAILDRAKTLRVRRLSRIDMRGVGVDAPTKSHGSPIRTGRTHA